MAKERYIAEILTVVMVIVCFVGLVVCVNGFVREFSKTRAGATLSHWLEPVDPNQLTE